MITLGITIEKSLEKMDQASEAKFLASRKDFLTLDSTSLANRNQEINFGNGRGKHSFFVVHSLLL